ncbi:MAG: hypothetical protein LC658_00080, partial [Bacteroidales bacterium]|nr:hypothetical protein [Bacteroidales bacterium]
DTMTINHGIPNSPFVYIVQPPSDLPYAERVQPNNPAFKRKVLSLKDPKTGQPWKAELWDIIRCKLHKLPDHMSRDMYGVNSLQLKQILEQRYPAIRMKQEVEILQLKKL